MLNEVSANLEHARAVQLRLCPRPATTPRPVARGRATPLGLLRYLAPRRSPRPNFKPQRA
jgi:hypothetical protein